MCKPSIATRTNFQSIRETLAKHSAVSCSEMAFFCFFEEKNGFFVLAPSYRGRRPAVSVLFFANVSIESNFSWRKSKRSFSLLALGW